MKPVLRLLPGALLLLLLFLPFGASAQVAGCNDPLANNYNPLATVNNGSCTYNTTSYSPPVKVDPLNSLISESSGLQMAGNFLWTFNDRNGQPAIYRIDTLSNAILQTVTLEGATNEDWEELTFDGTYFYVGDFGNNANGARRDLKIYKFPLSSIPSYTNSPNFTVPASEIKLLRFSYANQVQPPDTTELNKTRFDCEAMFVENGQIHLFSKNWLDTSCTHYVINSLVLDSTVAIPVETFKTGFLVTGMSKSPGQNVIALFGYQLSSTANHNIMLLSSYFNGLYFNGNKRKIELPGALSMGQGEGISFRNGYYGYLSNERIETTVFGVPIVVTQKLRTFDISSYVQLNYTFSGNGNWTNTSNWNNSTIPPAQVAAGSKIYIDPVTGGNCLLNISYTVSPGASLTVNPGASFTVGTLKTLITN